MQKRKVLSVLMTLAMFTSLVAGCGKSTTNTSLGSEVSESTMTTESNDTYEIVMPFVTTGTAPADLGKVQDAVSAYTKEKINCTVKFKPVAITDLTTQYNLWSASKEKVDMMFLYLTDLGSYVEGGQIIPLDDLLAKNAPVIMKDSKTSPFLKGGEYNNQTYAIPVINPSQGEGRAYYARTDLLKEAGYTPKDLYTYEDLDAIFAKIKEKHPDMTVIARAGAINQTYAGNFIPYDNLGNASAAAGVLMNIDQDAQNTKVTDLFETDEYKTFLNWQRKWYLAGYISKDAATTSDSAMDWVKSGRSAGFVVGDDTIGNEANQEAQSGYDMTQLNIRPTYVTTNTYSQLRWVVTSMSERPDKVLQFLDLMYGDEKLVNMIQNGIEGEHWVKTDNDKIIDFPKGINGTNTPFSNPLGIYGDKRIVYMFVPNSPDFYSISEKYTEDALKKPSKALGYSFVSTDYTTEIAAISSVLNQYLNTLEYGSVDVDKTLPEFIKALKDAGIDKVVQANQKQLDDWLSKQGSE